METKIIKTEDMKKYKREYYLNNKEKWNDYIYYLSNF